MIESGARKGTVGVRACGALLLCAVASCHGELNAGYNLPKGGDAGIDSGLCVPESTTECYTGPAGTNGVGLCRPGTATCNADGMTFGPCQAEVTPQPEDCATLQDADCDGLAPTCNEAQWSRQLPVSFLDATKNSAVDASGNVFVTGHLEDSIDLGGGALTSAGGSDVLIVKLDPVGNHVWSKRFGDVEQQAGQVIAVDTLGNVLVAGSFTGSVDFGGGALDAGTADNTFIAKFDSAGNHIWSRHLGGGTSYPASLAMDAAGSAVLGGNFTSSIDCGGGPMTSAGGGDLFVAKFNAIGDHVWSQRFGDPAHQWYVKCAIDSTDEVLITGSFEGQVSFGGGALTSAGDEDLFVAKLTGSGAHVWSQRFGDASTQRGSGVAVSGPGNLIIAGTFVGSLDFGNGPMMSAGNEDAFITKLNSAGQHVWSKRFGDGSAQRGLDVAVDTNGTVIMAGGFFHSIDFGSGPMVSGGDEDVYVTHFTADGEPLRSRRFGDGKQQVGRTIATDSTGNAVLTGSFMGTIDFGDGQLAPNARPALRAFTDDFRLGSLAEECPGEKLRSASGVGWLAQEGRHDHQECGETGERAP